MKSTKPLGRIRPLCRLLAAVLPVLLVLSAAAEPLTQLPDLTGTICWPDGTDETDAVLIYRYAYPQVAGDGETETTINTYYDYQVEDALAFRAPMRGEEIADPSVQAVTEIRYEIKANDDDFFSVLLIEDSLADGQRMVSLSAQNFSRDTEKPGNEMTLPYLLDILEDDAEDGWLRSRQTGRASEVVRSMVWAEIEERRAAGESFPEDWTREMLDYEFFPEYDFYYSDEEGLLVFFFQPYLNGPDMAPDSYYTFALDVEDIVWEM